MATLKTLCQTALREIGMVAVPSSFVGNTNPTAVQMLALANRVLRDISDYKWQIILSTYTFSTSNGVSTYALPTDFDSFANLTQWDRTNYEAMEGPVSPGVWEAIRSGNVVATGIKRYFRVGAGLFEIYPTPSSTDTIAYQYYSTYVITGKSEFSDDTDVSLVYEDVIVLGLKYYWRDAKGLDSTSTERAYRRKIEHLQGKDGGKDVLRFGSRPMPQLGGSIPEVGFG